MIMKGDNPHFSLDSYWTSVMKISQRLGYDEGYEPLYVGVRAQLRPSESLATGCSRAYICRTLSELVIDARQDLESRIATFSAVFDCARPESRLQFQLHGRARTAVDAISLIVSIALLSKGGDHANDGALYNYVVGSWLAWAQDHRQLFESDPKRAITDRLVEFAREESRLVPLVAELSKNWSQYSEAALGLHDELREIRYELGRGSNGQIRLFDQDAHTHILRALGVLQTAIESDCQIQEQQDERDLEEAEDADMSEYLTLIAGRVKSLPQAKIRHAVEQLSFEPEWSRPFFSFEPGGKFENCSATLCGDSPSGGDSWGPGGTTELGEQIFQDTLRHLSLLGFTQWHLLINSSALNHMLKQLDAANLDYDLGKLFALLQEQSQPHTCQVMSLASALGDPKLLRDKTFKNLSEWIRSLGKIRKHLADYPCDPITIDFREEMQDILRISKEYPGGKGLSPRGESDVVCAHPKLLRISGLSASVSWNVYPEISWRNISQAKHPLCIDLCPFDSYVTGAVADVARDMNLAAGTVVGLDYEKFASHFSLDDMPLSDGKLGSFDTMSDFESTKRGVALFYIGKHT
jgi:hypothetical protein